MFTSRKNKPRVKLVAVAKDESAYLPEWIHHHLYFGFAAIEVHINRTTDNSFALMEKIRQQYPNVVAKSADWIDLCPEAAQHHIQQLVYAMTWNEVQRSEDFDYIMFIDVDEFWMPLDMTTQIADVIDDLNYPDTISFQWFNEHGVEKPFSPLAQVIGGARHKLVKSVIKKEAKVSGMSLHLPRMRSFSRLLVDGKKFKPAPNQHEQLHPQLSKIRSCMIVHRLNRSPMEYVSLLNRGRPSKKLAIKTNRFGYNHNADEAESLVLNEENYQTYHRSYQDFLSKMAISSEMSEAQNFVKSRYNRTIDAINDVPIANAKEVVRAFGNCDDKICNALSKKYGAERFIESVKTPALLRDLAVAFERVDLTTSLKLMKRASELHPTGPQIQLKLANYLNQLGLNS